MRYRRLTSNGDYSFGNGQADFWINVPEAVAQAVQTRLGLWQGEWFLDTTDGTPWKTQILGRQPQPVYDMVLKQRTVQTQGMKALNDYSSALDRNTRRLTVTETVTTIYGTTTLQVTL